LVSADGNWSKFQQRLQWDGLTLDDARAVIRSAPSAGSATPLAESLKRLISTVRQHRDAVSLRALGFTPDPDQPIPFEDVLLPLLPLARQDLLDRLATGSRGGNASFHPLLTPEACRRLERDLLETLAALHAETLDFEFSAFRPFGYGVQGVLNATDESTTGGRTYYDAFVQELLRDGLFSLFSKYPVLGRLTALTITQWVDTVVELVERLVADLPRIVEVFGDLTPQRIELENAGRNGAVVSIAPSLSDRHHGGRSALALSFRSGLLLVYKPRDMGIEEALQRVMAWCNRQSPDLDFRTVRVLDSGTHGWMEFVAQEPCADAAAAGRFYRRAGRLLGLLHVLGASDCHRENLVANGEHPVLIDGEVLLNPEATPWGETHTGAENQGHRLLWSSVLGTGLLPRWQLGPDERVAYDISGLGSVEPQPTPAPMPRWRGVNSDDMHRVWEPCAMPVLENVPMLDGRALRPEDHLDEIVAGFRELYRFLMTRPDDLLRDADLVRALRSCRLRFLVRDTRVYGVLLQRALAPESMRDGAARGIELEALCRAYLTTPESPHGGQLLRAELDALERMDVPYFGSIADSDALTVGVDPPILRFFQRTAFEQLQERLASLDAANLERQIRIIRDVFLARGARAGAGVRVAIADLEQSSPKLSSTSIAAPPPDTESFAREAAAIAEGIRERALRGADGSVSWIDLQLLEAADRFQLKPLGASLYDGCCGVALFLAAYERVTGDGRFRDLVSEALHPVRELLRTSDDARARRAAQRLGLGGVTGLGSIVYALARAARWLDDDELLADARRAADWITPESIAADRQLDVMAGAAGALLGLLALHAATGDPTVLDRAVLCGKHLLQRREAGGNGARAWRTMDERLLTGFSHGAAGIAYALSRLFAATADDAFLAAAAEGIGYETSLFSPTAGNWADLRPAADGSEPSGPAFVAQWCHGAAGIGLGRLGGLTVLDTPAIRRDLEAALTTTLDCDWGGVDHLCCGNFGRIELLLEAGRRLARPELTATAAERTAAVVSRAARAGGYRLHAEPIESAYSPTLFRGAAGIGYQLLRLMEPSVVPSALLLE
jgi:type 2 lantibiotic biosynthesis protein LanM